MKKALLLVLAVIASCFLVANSDTLMSIMSAAQTGATIPLVIAIVIMVFRHLTQAVSYKAAFEAVDFKGRGLWEYVVLIFSLVFINTFCLFSGATGVAFIVDDAHRKGADLGKATSGAILSQIGYFAALLVISIIGFITMVVSNSVNVLFVVGALLLTGTLCVLSSMYVVGYFKPQWLYKLFGWVQKPVGAVARKVNHPLKASWGKETADSFIKAARVMAANPQGTVVSIAWASLSAVLNMASLIAIGYALGFSNVPALIAAFALGAISVILSPTPQGIGVVEAAITAVLTAYGCLLPTATAIALLYRGIMFWIPFCIGAVLLSQSGFFHDKKDPTQEARDKDVAWLTGTAVGIIGIVSVVSYFLPSVLAPYRPLVEWIDFSNIFAGPAIAFFGVLLIILAVGLVKRYRTCMAITVTVLVLIASAEFLFFETVTVAIIASALAVWIFVKRSSFDKPMPTFASLLAGRGGKASVAANAKPAAAPSATADAVAQSATGGTAVGQTAAPTAANPSASPSPAAAAAPAAQPSAAQTSASASTRVPSGAVTDASVASTAAASSGSTAQSETAASGDSTPAA